MVVILFVAFLLFFLLRYDYHKHLLRALIDAYIIFSALTLFAIEVLSLFSLYTTIYVFLFWVLVCVVCALFFRSRLLRGLSLLRCTKLASGDGSEHQAKRNILSLLRLEYIAFAVIIMLCAVTLVSAIIHPSVNYDSQVFHLPRAFFWIQDGSVHNFPSHVGRQLYSGPYNAFTISQILLLSHGLDWLINIPQWLAYVGTIIVTALIAAELGLNKRWQTVAALLAATIPMSVLQAVTTQNDLTIAFWVAVSVYYVLRLIKDEKMSDWLDTGFMLGISVGIAMLTKLSAAPTLLPFALMVILLKLRKKHFSNFIRVTAIVLSCILIICAGFFIRNAIDLEGDFLGMSAPENNVLNVETRSPRYLTVLMAKNLAYNFGSPSEIISGLITDSVAGFSSVLNVDVNDPDIELGTWGVHNRHFFLSDDKSSPVHSVLVLFTILAFAILLIQSKRKQYNISYIHISYMVAIVVSFCITSISFRFWYFSTPRFLLPSLVIAMPIVAVVLHRIIQSRLNILAVLLAIIVSVYAAVAITHYMIPVLYIFLLILFAIPAGIIASRNLNPNVTSATILSVLLCTVLYTFMPLQGPAGNIILAPTSINRLLPIQEWGLELIDDAMLLEGEIVDMHLSDLDGTLSYREWRQRRAENLLRHKDPEFFSNADNFISQHEVTRIGMYRFTGPWATYPILSRFLMSDIEVRNINPSFHRQAVDHTFSPQAIYATNADSEAIIIYNGISFIPIYVTETFYDNYILFLVEEDLFKQVYTTQPNDSRALSAMRGAG